MEIKLPNSSEQLLVRFIRLCGDALAAPQRQEAAALIVNRIAEISRTDRAVLVVLGARDPLLAVSGGAELAQDHAFADAMCSLRELYSESNFGVLVQSLSNGEQHPALFQLQQEMGGSALLWLPLQISADGSDRAEYALCLQRWSGISWHQNDLQLLQHAAPFLGQALQRQRKKRLNSQRRWWWGAAALLLATLFVPVTASITAPLKIIADRPAYLFSSMDGIVRELHVRPGQWVEVGTPLFSFDARVLDKRLQEAQQKVAVVRAELMSQQAAAYGDSKARAEVPVKQLQVEQAEADVRFYQMQRQRADVKAEQAGVVVLDDPEALIGASLRTGELVMSLADPERVKARLMVVAGDVGLVDQGAKMELRLDHDPFRVLQAKVAQVGFEVRLSEDQVPSVIVDGVWENTPSGVRPGQRGVAKVFSKTTFLGVQLLRKPWLALRGFLGL
ncbi:MAG: efflux RND transporter periplasmic adaptor subunit [Gammaproteobacteria bacterium]|nr:efflux RND transporter periplasmic adaptor subunit [Gammaproteobacteria bacterium]